VCSEHPRLFITRDNLAEQRRRLNPRHPAWEKLVALAKQGNAAAAGLCYQMTGEREFAQTAARALRQVDATRLNYTQSALAFDWAFAGWDKATQTEMIQHFVNVLNLREGTMPLVSSYCDLNRPLPSQTPERRWFNFYNWTFHSEDWADCSQLGSERYSPYFALAGHHPQATKAAQAIWEMSFKDPALFLEYLEDGGYWEGGYWSTRGKMAKIASVFAITNSSMGLGKEALPYLRNFGYFLLYQTDFATGKLTMPYGDSEMRESWEWQTRQAMLATNYFARRPVYQWYLNHLTRPVKPLDEAIWFDPRVKEEHPRALPPTRLFPKSRMVIFRSGWEGKGDCIALFRVGDWFDLHNHHDAGHFMFYKDGFLVGKARFYGDVFGHTFNHNTFAMEAPGDYKGGQRKYRRTWSFRIGRKAWRQSPKHFHRGEILKFESSKEYDYVAANVAPAYPSENVKEFTRQIVFLRPGAMVIFDRTEVAPQISRRFLAHVVSPPRWVESTSQRVNGSMEGKFLPEEKWLSVDNPTIISQGSGPHALVMRTLLPQRTQLRIWHEFGDVAPWRVDVGASEKQARACFLHLLYPSSANEEPPSVRQVKDVNDVVSLEIQWHKRTYRMTFRQNGRVEGNVEVSGDQ
jgi:hypothetical protein